MVDLITQAPPCGPDPPELAAAEPDPLAATEAELLTHLAGAHGDAVGLLAQLVDRRFLLGVTRVDPLRLDRYGVVLRLPGEWIPRRTPALSDLATQPGPRRAAGARPAGPGEGLSPPLTALMDRRRRNDPRLRSLRDRTW
jgi:hypothetical protein